MMASSVAVQGVAKHSANNYFAICRKPQTKCALNKATKMANILLELQDRKFRHVIIQIRNKKCSFA